MTFGDAVAVIGSYEGLHRACVVRLLVRVGIGSGLPPGIVARAVISGDASSDHPCDPENVGRIIGNLLADFKVCGPCADVALEVLDQ